MTDKMIKRDISFVSEQMIIYAQSEIPGNKKILAYLLFLFRSVHNGSPVVLIKGKGAR